MWECSDVVSPPPHQRVVQSCIMHVLRSGFLLPMMISSSFILSHVVLHKTWDIVKMTGFLIYLMIYWNTLMQSLVKDIRGLRKLRLRKLISSNVTHLRISSVFPHSSQKYCSAFCLCHLHYVEQLLYNSVSFLCIAHTL